MEHQQHIDNLPYLSSVVNVRDFLNTWKAHIFNDKHKLWQTQEPLASSNLTEITGLPAATVSELKRVCDEGNLQLPGLNTTLQNLTEIPNNVEHDLLTLRLQNKELEKRKEIPSHKHKMWTIMRNHRGSIRHQRETKKKKILPVDDIDVVLTIQLFRPLLPSNSARVKGQSTLSLDREVVFLGKQKLSELRDIIACPADVSNLTEISDNPQSIPDIRAVDLYPSSYLFINDTFYNDTRNIEAKDLSSDVIRWARERGIHVNPIPHSMEEATFLDLRIRIGLPYVFVHQGDCEHLVVFSDLRILHPDDVLEASSYPILSSVCNRRRVICIVCHMYTARWVTYDDKLSSQDPGFFCDQCFHSLHYDKDMNKIAPFRAYTFIDKSAAMF